MHSTFVLKCVTQPQVIFLRPRTGRRDPLAVLSWEVPLQQWAGREGGFVSDSRPRQYFLSDVHFTYMHARFPGGNAESTRAELQLRSALEAWRRTGTRSWLVVFAHVTTRSPLRLNNSALSQASLVDSFLAWQPSQRVPRLEKKRAREKSLKKKEQPVCVF